MAKKPKPIYGEINEERELDAWKQLFPIGPCTTFQDVADCAHIEGFMIVQIELAGNNAIVTYAKLEDC